MGRYRSRSRSYSPAVQRKRYDDPRDRNRSRRSPGPSGLLVRNISLDSRPEDLRIPFERFGPLKDVYLPKNYYTGEPRGFGFVKFRYAEDAAEAKEQLNRTVIGGREIRIVFAEENRKTPKEMRKVSHVSSRGSYRRRSPSRSPRRRYHSHSRSPSPARDGSRDRRTRGGHYSSRQQSRSRSMSPCSERDHKSSRRLRSISRSPSFHDEHRYKSNQRPSIERESGQSPYDEKYVRGRSASPRGKRSLPRSRSPSYRDHRTRGGHYSSRQQSRSRSMSPRSERDHRSSRRPRSISRSPSFHDEQRYKLNQRPSVERKSGQSPYDEKYVRGRSASARGKRSPSRSRSPSYSPR